MLNNVPLIINLSLSYFYFCRRRLCSLWCWHKNGWRCARLCADPGSHKVRAIVLLATLECTCLRAALFPPVLLSLNASQSAPLHSKSTFNVSFPLLARSALRFRFWCSTPTMRQRRRASAHGYVLKRIIVFNVVVQEELILREEFPEASSI